MTCRFPTLFLLAALLPTSFNALGDDTPPPTDSQPAAAPAEPAAPPALDPAHLGLDGFPAQLVTSEDFTQALDAVDARIEQIERNWRRDRPAETADGEESGDTASTEDRRIAPLQALKLALQRRASWLRRDQELAAAETSLDEERAALERDGLSEPPPYSIAMLDQLRTERELGKHAAQAAQRALAVIQRQVDSAQNAVTSLDQERRLIRDRLDDTPGDRELERQLEAASIAALAARQRLAAAQTRLALAQRERDLARQRLDLIELRIDRVKDQVAFPQEALDERLQELDARKETLERRLAALTKASEAAEGELFEAQERLKRAGADENTEALQAQVAAQEAELKTPRKGIAYLRHAIEGIASARTFWKRRYALRQEIGDAPLGVWLSETDDRLEEIDEEIDYAQAELSTLRSMMVTLARRLDEPDLEPKVRAALERRKLALDEQEELTEELLIYADQSQTLANRLKEELEPLVRTRTVEQRVAAAKTQLRTLWDKELFVFQDEAFYLRDLVVGGSVFVLVLVVVSLLKTLLKRIVLPHLTGPDLHGQRAPRALVSALIRNTSQIFVVIIAFYAAMAASGLAQGSIESWLWTSLVVIFWVQIGIWANAGAVDFVNRQRSRKERLDPSAVTGYGLILFFVRAGIWSIVLISVLTHFNYPITGLIGALGVGGIAVAFAIQNVLADVFSSMAIILDKPFRVGDFVVTGSTLGVIEQIGVKTTRIRSLSGEQVTMSNTDLLNSRIHNYKRMEERRVVFKLGLVYETPPELLERIPGMIKEIILEQRFTRFDRAHFFEYGDFALLFEIVYYVQGADYTRYMDIQQAINLAINRRFRAEGVEFAYPTQELIVRRGQRDTGIIGEG